MNNRFVFDLDNTLVMTDELNTASYNYALNKLKIPPIYGSRRITKDLVFSHYPMLSDAQKNIIMELKQSYFIENIHFTHLNKKLINLMKLKKPAHSVLWTRADKNRVNALLMHYGLEKHFATIFYSNKRKLSEDIVEICNIFDCDPRQLIFFEDDLSIINKLKLLGHRVLQRSASNSRDN